jgi:hypothetical protein
VWGMAGTGAANTGSSLSHIGGRGVVAGRCAGADTAAAGARIFAAIFSI